MDVDRPVQLETFVAGTDAEGNEAIAFGFAYRGDGRVSDDDLWIIGTAMTPFGRHLDRDVTDLAVEASLGALRDAGTTMRRRAGDGGRQPVRAVHVRPAGAEADRPDRHPALQRAQRLRHRGHRHPLGDHGDPGRRGRHRPGRRRGADVVRLGALPDVQARPRRAPSRPRAATATCCPPRACSAPGTCGACSPRPASTTPASTTASASSSSPRWRRRTTPTRR